MVTRRAIVGGIGGLLAGLAVSESVEDDSTEFVGAPGGTTTSGAIATMTSVNDIPIKIFETYSEASNFEPDTTPTVGIVLETQQIVEWGGA